MVGYVIRKVDKVNVLGTWTLYVKEVRRFLNVATQTVLAPVVTTLLFLAAFSLSQQHHGGMVQSENFLSFLTPGLIVMAMVQNAFANTSSSLMLSKMQGNIVDCLMAPLSAGELTTGYAVGGLTRGLVVGTAVTVAVMFFVPLHFQHVVWIIVFGCLGSMILSLLGIMAGIWSEKYDHLAAVTNFVITPLAFLSGTFYSVRHLPEMWQKIAFCNPFFYLIDGFRFGFIGQADANVYIGAMILLFTNIVLWWGCFKMFGSGYRLKS